MDRKHGHEEMKKTSGQRSIYHRRRLGIQILFPENALEQDGENGSIRNKKSTTQKPTPASQLPPTKRVWHV